MSTFILTLFIATSALADTPLSTTSPADDIAPEPAADAPLAFPPLDYYAKLWDSSMFTTKSLPPPDTGVKGPVFTDALTLSGTYEIDGALVGVIMDKTTSLVTQVRIGSENENGIKIVKVNPDKSRMQLQKGEEIGWITTASDNAPPADGTQGPPGAPNGIPGTAPQPGMQPAAGPVGSTIPARPMVPQPISNQPRRIATPPQMQQPQPVIQSQQQVAPQLPPVTQPGEEGIPRIDDVPLPPP